MTESPVRAVIFDWAGTVVDHGSRAPVIAFTELFRREGISLNETEARGPMGTPKKDHIRSLLNLPSIAEQWRKLHLTDPAPADVDQLYEKFIPLQTEIIGQHMDVIPGTAEVLAALRERGIRIGSTTGYSRAMMRDLIPAAARGGFDPDCVVCADEVSQGRPAPWMALHAAMQLGAYPVFACVKVGDTVADVAEGRNAGMWTVAVTETGGESDARLKAARANYVIGSVAALMPTIDAISWRLLNGECLTAAG